jgi:Histone chaperone domain CHZ
MEEIDTSNILGRRTRGKTIDYAEAEQKAKEAGDTLEDDEDEEDDEDFEEPEGADRMEE